LASSGSGSRARSRLARNRSPTRAIEFPTTLIPPRTTAACAGRWLKVVTMMSHTASTFAIGSLLFSTAIAAPKLSDPAPPPATSAGAEATSSSSTANAPVAERSDFWWGDYDGDGRKDAFVITTSGQGRLLHNEGDGTFKDVTTQAGLLDVASVHI